MIWQICPKHLYNGLTAINIDVGIATLVFNDGSQALQAPLRLLEVTCGKFMLHYFARIDYKRLLNAQNKVTEATLEARRARRRRRLGLDDAQVEAEGYLYLAGGY